MIRAPRPADGRALCPSGLKRHTQRPRGITEKLAFVVQSWLILRSTPSTRSLVRQLFISPGLPGRQSGSLACCRAAGLDDRLARSSLVPCMMRVSIPSGCGAFGVVAAKMDFRRVREMHVCLHYLTFIKPYLLELL